MGRELRSCVWKGGAKRGKVLVCVAVRCTGEARSIAWQGRSGRRDKCAVQVAYRGFYARLLSARRELTSLLYDNAIFLNDFGFWSFSEPACCNAAARGAGGSLRAARKDHALKICQGSFAALSHGQSLPMHAEPHPMHHPSSTGNEIRNLTAAVF